MAATFLQGKGSSFFQWKHLKVKITDKLDMDALETGTKDDC